MFVLNIILRLPFSIIVYLTSFLFGVRQWKSFSHYVTSLADSLFQNKNKMEDQNKRPIFCDLQPILKGLHALLAADPSTILFHFNLNLSLSPFHVTRYVELLCLFRTPD